MTREELKTEIELYADKQGMYSIRQIMSEICFEKSEHVRTNYPESSSLAASWDKLGEIYLYELPLNDSTKRLEETGI